LNQITTDLTKNDNIAITLQNLRTSSEKLKSTLTSLGPSLQQSADNVKDATATLKSQPWRLVWPSTKKYPEKAQSATVAGQNIKAAKSSRSPRPSPTPARGASR
jgi:hypothetical protein